MRGIYTLSASLRLGGRADLSRLELLLLALSVLEWRHWNGHTTLYCDESYARYLDDIGLLALWDEVDNVLLTRAPELARSTTSFWTIGRTLAIRSAPIPFAAVDCDLITWRSLRDDLPAGEIAFTHWESTEPSPWYPPPHELRRPDTYRLDRRRDWSLQAANVSIAYFGSAAVRDAYVTESLGFCTRNSAAVPMGLDVAPELLFADQRLLPIIAAELGIAARPIIDALWSPSADQFVEHDARFGPWDPLAVDEQPLGITHAWFYKSLLSPEDPRRRRLTSDLDSKLRDKYPDVASGLSEQRLI